MAMPVIDNNKKLSSTEEREILDIMTSPDEQAKIDLLKLRVLVERNNDVEKGVLNAFHNDPLLKSKAVQLRDLLFHSAVGGNRCLREYENRLSQTHPNILSDKKFIPDIEGIGIVQAGMITCTDIKDCPTKDELEKGHRGEWTATHLTYHAVDSSLGPNTFNQMMRQLKEAGYEGKTITNIPAMLHILFDSMIQTIKPFAQATEIIPPGTKLKPIVPKPSPAPNKPGNQPTPNPTKPQPKTPNKPNTPSPNPKPKAPTTPGTQPAPTPKPKPTNPGNQPQPKPNPTNPKAPTGPGNQPTPNPTKPNPNKPGNQPTPNPTNPGNGGKTTPKTGPGSTPSQPEAPEPTPPNTAPTKPQPKTPNKPNTPSPNPKPKAPNTPKTPDQPTDQCDQFGNTIKQIATIDELPSSRTDDVVYYLTIGTTQYIFYHNQRVANVDQKKMMNRSKDANGSLTIDGVIINPTPPSPETIPADLTRWKRMLKQREMINAGHLEPRALKKSGVEIDSSISYTELAETINNIGDEPLRKEMVRVSLVDTTDEQGQPISKALAMQKLFGMKQRLPTDDFYPENAIQPAINRISLQRFAIPNRVLWGEKEILRSTIPDDVKSTREKFHNGDLPTNHLNYFIISKTDFNIYFFTDDHQLVSRQSVLLGKTKGDTPWGKDPNISTTPPGQYQVASKRADPRKNYGEPGFYSLLVPMEDQYHIWTKADGSHDTSHQKMDLRIHPTVNPKIREPLLQAGVTIDKKRISNGCVNLSRNNYMRFFDHVVYDNQLNIGSTVYITPEATSSTAIT